MNAAIGLRVSAGLLGVFFLAMASNKVTWLGDPSLLSMRFERWIASAAPPVAWYLQTIALPGAPLFARLVPMGECATGLALVLGWWPRTAAAIALFMILNFHFATGAFFDWAFLRDGTGPPLIGALLAVALGGSKLPWSLRS